MARPPMFPPPQFPPVRLRAFQRMPPAVFPAILGLMALGLALRRAMGPLGLPVGIAEAVLGAVSLLWVFAALGYGVKLARRPGVLWEDLAVLPGRGGVSAMMLGALALAVALVPYAPFLAEVVLFAGLSGHFLVAALLIRATLVGPPEARVVTPVWHLNYVAFILAGVSAAELGFATLATGLLALAIPIAMGIWGISLWQMLTRVPPGPLRPLLAIHLAPASLIGTVAVLTGHIALAEGFAALGGALLLALLASARWITVAGFSPLWASFTFPLAAYAGLLLALGGVFLAPGVAVLIAALGIIPPIALHVLKSWADGTLGARTNAATA